VTQGVVPVSAEAPAVGSQRTLRQKNVLVTGGTRGIGLAVVRAMAREGANVSFSYLQQDAAARALQEELVASHPQQRFHPVRYDAADYDGTRRGVNEVVEALGPLDVLVNNAGIVQDGSIVQLTPHQWSRVIEVNLTGAFNAAKAVAFGFMKRKAGVIVNITSVAGIYGNAGQTNYAASKAGLIGFTLSLAKEAGPYGVRVVAVAPGFIETDLSRHLLQARGDGFRKMTALRRIGTANEVAGVVVFVASDAAAYLTGEVIRVDGGLSL
jgi:3-oxoacyl-[acyl-carrier protein] reductase